MSDTMLLGVLRMPFDLAMATLTAQIQYHQRGVQAADEIEKLTRERDEARAAARDGGQAMTDKISEIRARHQEGIRAGADADRAYLLAEVERLTRQRDEARAGNDKKLAERLARVQFGGNSWRASNEQFRLSVALIWIEHIKTIRRAGLELVEREEGR